MVTINGDAEIKDGIWKLQLVLKTKHNELEVIIGNFCFSTIFLFNQFGIFFINEDFKVLKVLVKSSCNYSLPVKIILHFHNWLLKSMNSLK